MTCFVSGGSDRQILLDPLGSGELPDGEDMRSFGRVVLEAVE